MFFEGSRYLQVKEYDVEDASGRGVKVKRARANQTPSGTFTYQVKEGDRLDLLAFKFYRTPRKWWLIADANPSFTFPGDLLKPGQLLIIPKDQGV